MLRMLPHPIILPDEQSDDDRVLHDNPLNRVFHFPRLLFSFSNYRREEALEEQVTDPPPVRPAQINWRGLCVTSL